MHAGHVKNVPGRKTDFSDAEWLAHLLECGLLAGSFIPPAQVKAPRDVLRYRTKAAQQRVSEIARLGNVLQDGIKIDSVASSIATRSGRAMIEALIDGERRGRVLAELAKGKMRVKIPDRVRGAARARNGLGHAGGRLCRRDRAAPGLRSGFSGTALVIRVAMPVRGGYRPLPPPRRPLFSRRPPLFPGARRGIPAPAAILSGAAHVAGLPS